MARNDRTLRRLLRKPAVARLVSDQIDRLGGDLVVTDPGGQALVGDGSRITGPSCEISLDGRELGRVHGAHGAILGEILNTLVSQDAESRALARESLDRYKEITMLYEVSERIISSPDAQSVAAVISEEAERFLDCDSATVLLVNEETGRLEIVESRGPPFHSRASLNIGDDVISAVIRSGTGEIVNDLGADSRSLDADNALQSIVCSPLKSKRRILGVVVAGTESPRHFNAADLEILNAMAAQAATAIEAAHLDRDLKTISRKPADLIYGINERPPISVSIVLGLQHVFIAMMSLAYPVLITLESGGSRNVAASVVSMSLIAMSIATLLQVNRIGPIGSGFLGPHITSAIFLGPSLLAARVGGLGLVFGMTVMAGAFGLLLSQLLGRFRKLFPPEVSGVVVLMVGLSLVPVAFSRLLGLDKIDKVSEPTEWIVGLITLGAIVGLTIAPIGRLRLYSTFLGVLIGYLAAMSMGMVDDATFEPILDLPIIGIQPPPLAGLDFSLMLALPFLVSALASGIKDAGLVISSQKLNDAQWKRPDTGSVSGGIVAGGIGNITAGLLGGVGLGISAGSVGLSAATGATSRVVGIFAAAIFLALAFMPKVTAAVALMPLPVMGAGLLYVACHLVTSGTELITLEHLVRAEAGEVREV